MLLAALLAFQAGALPPITLAPKPGGGKLHAENFPETQYDAVLAAMIAKGNAHCGKLKTRWGRFNNKMNTLTLTSGKTENRYAFYDQAFTCFDPATDPYKAVAADWKPSDADKSDALIFAERHLAAMDRNDVAAAMAGFEPLLELSRADAVATIDDYRSRTKDQVRNFRPLVWVNNVDGAAHPGAYAYAPFDGARSCGFLLLYRAAPGKYQVSQIRVFGQLATDRWTDQSAAALKKQCDAL
ncbi:hypothetical protein AB2M62_07575 [Sphingomonas sp. MMS12-HWE2-04]|uniref:hypothetical protein n=1 Tax=Sphingomonas sp. MMS12-HWE2-04 TaxID=3234199 RepID=UPI00384E2EE0